MSTPFIRLYKKLTGTPIFLNINSIEQFYDVMVEGKFSYSVIVTKEFEQEYVTDTSEAIHIMIRNRA